MLLNTKENAVENEMPILPPFVEQEEEDDEEVEKKKTEPELEEKVEAIETNKEEEKEEGKEKGSNVHVDLTSSEYFAKHPKAIANPQERSVSQSCQSINRIKSNLAYQSINQSIKSIKL